MKVRLRLPAQPRGRAEHGHAVGEVRAARGCHRRAPRLGDLEVTKGLRERGSWVATWFDRVLPSVLYMLKPTSKFDNDQHYLQEVDDWSVLSPLAFQKVCLIFWMLLDVCETAILPRPTPDLWSGSNNHNNDDNHNNNNNSSSTTTTTTTNANNDKAIVIVF